MKKVKEPAFDMYKLDPVLLKKHEWIEKDKFLETEVVADWSVFSKKTKRKIIWSLIKDYIKVIFKNNK